MLLMMRDGQQQQEGKKMKTITKITVTPKKGETIDTTWHIYQQRPYPRISITPSARWENGRGVFREYGNDPKGLDAQYTAVLLRDGYDAKNAKDNRLDYAGYGCNGGTITLRGHDMGEMVINLSHYVDIRVRGFDRPTDGEHKFIKAQIVPALRTAIEQNKTALYEEAVDGIERSIAEHIAEARTGIDRLEAEGIAAIEKLWTLTP
jgi:hypothetical protein